MTFESYIDKLPRQVVAPGPTTSQTRTMKKTDYDDDNELKGNYTPKFPSDSSDFVAVGAWKDEMVGRS